MQCTIAYLRINWSVREVRACRRRSLLKLRRLRDEVVVALFRVEQATECPLRTAAAGRRRHHRSVRYSFAALRQLRQIRRSVPPTTFQSLVVTLVLSRLDYGNAVLVGLPAYLVRRLQLVLNAAARLIYRMRSADHITDALACLLAARLGAIDFKVAVLTYKVLHGSAPR